MALTAKKRLFAEAVLGGKSNKDAAIAAGYSAATASAAGSRLVKDPAMVAYLATRRESPAEQPAATNEPLPPPLQFDLNKALQHSDPKAFLLAAMNDTGMEHKLRVDAAKALMPFMHTKRGEGGKKDERGEAAKRAEGKFSALPPPLKLINGK